MSLANTALLFNMGLLGTPLYDNLLGGPAAAQATALPLPGEMNRVTAGANNQSFILRSIKSGEASTMTVVVNDGPNACQVFPAVGENQNGVANAALSIPAGQSGLFVLVPNKLGGPDWRSNVIA
jgi:hypothetical protein